MWSASSARRWRHVRPVAIDQLLHEVEKLSAELVAHVEESNVLLLHASFDGGGDFEPLDFLGRPLLEREFSHGLCH